MKFVKLLFAVCCLLVFSCKQEKQVKNNFEKHKDKVVIYSKNADFSPTYDNFTWGLKSLDKTILLELCYGGTYDVKYDATLWTPLLGDANEFHAWTDKQFLNPTIATGIDTIYQMKKGNNEQAIVIFKTSYEWISFYNQYTQAMEDLKKPSPCGDGMRNVVYSTKRFFGICPIGIAIFEKDLNNVWVLTHLNKNIGEPGMGNFEPEDSIFQIGTENVSISDDKIKNFAITDSIDDGYSKEYSRKRPIWAINFHEFVTRSNSSYDQNSIYIPNYYGNIKRAITLEKSTSFWHDAYRIPKGEPEIYHDITFTYKLIERKNADINDILAHRKGIVFDRKKRKTVKIDDKILYQFDTEENKYVHK
jgi:hypothetical protein